MSKYESIYIFPFQSADSKDKFNGFIPVDKLDITYSASSGPGGQNVNKVGISFHIKLNTDAIES